MSAGGRIGGLDGGEEVQETGVEAVVGTDVQPVVVVEQLQVAGVGKGESGDQYRAGEGRSVGDSEELDVDQHLGGGIDAAARLPCQLGAAGAYLGVDQPLFIGGGDPVPLLEGVLPCQQDRQ